MSKIIYIASLAHSGSTLLDLLLGANSSAVSLGEAHRSIKEHVEPERICTCGRKVDQCDVWGPLRAEIAHKKLGHKEAYLRLLELVHQCYGNDRVIIDSSKYIPHLRFMKDQSIGNVKIIFLIKDIRSYTISQANRKLVKTKMEHEGWRALYRTSIPYNTVMWYWKNRKMQQFLDDCKLPYLQVGYEELCFQPELILRKICEFIDISYEDRMLSPQNSTSHIVRGNQMRYNPAMTRSIQYDFKWFYSKKIFWFWFFILPFLGWNNKNVFRNLNREVGYERLQKDGFR